MNILNLDPTFRPYSSKIDNYNEIQFESFIFGGGEPHLKLKNIDPQSLNPITVSHRLISPLAIMQLLLAVNAIRQTTLEKVTVNAIIPYLPGARQDRIMVGGEPFTLGIMANLINSCEFARVEILDVHSDVSAALINNFHNLYSDFINNVSKRISSTYGEYVVIAPDGGALKKVYKNCSSIYYKGDVFDASKLRDVRTGKIIRTQVNAPKEAIEGKNVWIMDDICSRGGTFIALATELKKMGAKNVFLSVSHYEGTADINQLTAGGIDHIYTTNSMGNWATNDYITTYKL